MKVFSENKKAYFEYEILDKLDAGMVLSGQEVKSIKMGRINLAGSYVVLKDNEAFLVGSSVPAYQPKNASPDYDPQRSRKLLLKKQEINRLIGKTKEKGLTLIPLKVYSNKGKIKLEFGIGKGKKTTDKRDVIRKRDVDREIARELRSRG
jgi:SsrA-binding protein